MSAILSELSNKVNISSLKNKLTDVYATINDKITTVKEALSAKSQEKPLQNDINHKKEGYDAPAPPQSTKDKIMDFLNKLKDYSIIFVIFLLKSILYVLPASLVANDMIIYAPTIRAFFFVFTLILTYILPVYAGFLLFYYALRKGYDYYHDKLSSEVVKPPKSFPMLFAILPLTTYYPDTSLVRFFLWAFMYQKSDNIDRMTKENKRLHLVMNEYWDSLNKSFDYLDKIKSSEPFSRLYKLNKEHLTAEYMHPIQKKDSGEMITSNNEVKETPNAPVKFYKMQAAPVAAETAVAPSAPPEELQDASIVSTAVTAASSKNQ